MRAGTLIRTAVTSAVVAVLAVIAVPIAAARTTGPSGPHSSGCGAPVTAGTTQQSIISAGTVRLFRLAVPADSGRRALPLILNFHGYGSNAGEQAVYSQLEAKGPAHGYVVATPQGTAKPAFWNILPNLAAPDDVAYTNALIDHLEQTLCIDPTRIYSTGISNGAGLSTLLGCRIPSRLAAIAPVSGVNLVASCPKGSPLSVLVFHGNADPVVAYGGGHTSASLAGLPLDPVPTSVAAWAKRDRCTAKPTVSNPTPRIQLTSYQGCAAGTNVELYTVDGGGHTWPGSIDVARLGTTTHEINAADLMLAFFAHHTRPGAK